MRLLVTDAAAQPPRQATAWLIMTLGKNTMPSLPLEPLEQARKRTKDASTVGFVSAALTACVSIFATVQYSNPASLLLLADAGLIAGLAFGVRKHSRVCASILVIYWVISKWSIWSEEPPSPWGLIVAILFWVSFIGGTVGAFTYHKLINTKEPNEAT